MPRSFNQIWIHAIWSTKHRQNLVHKEIEEVIYNFMERQFEELGCQVKAINGMPDHVHSLFKLSSQKSIAQVIKQVKGSTAFYVNQQSLTDDYFNWQSGYGAFSVSESLVGKVQRYIQRQKEHHTKSSFEHEYSKLCDMKGIIQ